MELEQKILELQDTPRILRTHMNASHDPFHFKFPPEIASLIFYLSMTEQDHEPSVHTLRLLPTPFLLGSVSRRPGWRQLAHSAPQLWSTTDGDILTSFMDAMVFPSLEKFEFISEQDWTYLDTDSLTS